MTTFDQLCYEAVQNKRDDESRYKILSDKIISRIQKDKLLFTYWCIISGSIPLYLSDLIPKWFVEEESMKRNQVLVDIMTFVHSHHTSKEINHYKNVVMGNYSEEEFEYLCNIRDTEKALDFYEGKRIRDKEKWWLTLTPYTNY